MREVIRATPFWIDTLYLAYETAAGGYGQTTAARHVDVNVGATNELRRSAAHPFYTRLDRILKQRAAKLGLLLVAAEVS
jgi:hypothetical protein